MKIYFDVKNQIITRTDRNQVIANSADYLEAEITFSAEWASMEKTMTFKNGNLLYTYVLVNDKILEENHLNLGVGTWKVSIHGVNEDKKIVTNECNLAVNASGWIGSEALPPESIWNQLLVIIQSLHTEVASTAALRSAVQKYIEDNYDALVKEAVIVDDVRAALDDMAEDGTLSDLLAPLVAAGMPEVVADQISAVVAAQIGGVVANQIGAVVASQITTPVNQAVKNYCDDNFSGWSGALDRGLTQPLMAAPADMVGAIKSALSQSIHVDHGPNMYTGLNNEHGYFDSQGNLIGTDTAFLSTDFIDVRGLTAISYSAKYGSGSQEAHGLRNLCVYDENKDFIEMAYSGTNNNPTYTIASGVAYVRFSFNSSTYSQIMLVSGGTPSLDYVAYYSKYSFTNTDYVTMEDVKDEFDIDLIQTPNRNLVNVENSVDGYIGSSGQITVYSDWKSTEFIQVEYGKKYFCTILYNNGNTESDQMKYYYEVDANGDKVSYSSGGVESLRSGYTPSSSSVKQVRFSYHGTNVSNVMFHEGYGGVAAKNVQAPYSVIDDKMIKPTHYGQKWVVFGDSLTDFNQYASVHYFDYIADLDGYEVSNYGYSGTGYKVGESNTRSFYQRMLNVDPNLFDVLTVMGTFNDASIIDNNTITIGDITDTGTNTLCGCINTMIDNFYTIARNKPIGIITPPPTLYRNPTDSTSNNIVNAIIDICKYRCIPYLDLFHAIGLNPWYGDASVKADYIDTYYTEGSSVDSSMVHPNSLAHKLFLAPKIREFVNSLILPNMSE